MEPVKIGEVWKDSDGGTQEVTGAKDGKVWLISRDRDGWYAVTAAAWDRLRGMWTPVKAGAAS